MRDNLYSSKSDVWAFSVVLWEIGTLGEFVNCGVDSITMRSITLCNYFISYK